MTRDLHPAARRAALLEIVRVLDADSYVLFHLVAEPPRGCQGQGQLAECASGGRRWAMKLGWSVKNSRVAWRGRFPVIEDLLRADHDGREHLYTYLGIKSTAVGVLAVDEQDRLLLVNEYRHPMGKVLTDIPMGTVERGENLVQAAARELREETGWIAGSLEHIGGLHPVPALTSLRFDFYLARDLSEGEAEPDETELIGVQWMDLGEAMRRLLAGELTHGGLPMALPLVLQKGILKLPDLDGGSG